MTTASKSLFKTIALTGFIAGTLDIAIALIMYVSATGKSALIVLRFIASGVFGTEAFGGGTPMAIVGLVLHYIIAYSFTVAYFLVYKIISSISKNWIVNAIVYGVLVWVIMNLLILPLSNVPPQESDLVKTIKGAVILIIAIGVPVSFSAKKYFSK